MKKALVVYDTTFGNTKILAEEIAAGIREAGNVTCEVKSYKELNGGDVTEYSAVLFGSPIHATRATRGIKGAIKKAAKDGLDGKIVSTFDTYMSRNQSGGVRNMEGLLAKVAPAARLVSPGLSALVDGVRGPLNSSEFSRAREFGKSIGHEMLR
ncbi:MAG: flavodoxin family protein [Promethearchaeota archaeon]